MIKPPQCGAIQELNLLLLKLGEMEGTVIALKEQLRTVPYRLAKEISGEGERLDAARYLYWYTDIPASAIAEALLNMKSKGNAANGFLRRIGPLETDITCERCGNLIVCEKRDEFRELERGTRSSGMVNSHIFQWDGGARQQKLCAECMEVSWRERSEKRAARRSNW